MESIRIDEIRVSANLGANVGECIKECIELAAREWHNVTLTHNGKEYRILCNELFSTVKEHGGE